MRCPLPRSRDLNEEETTSGPGTTSSVTPDTQTDRSNERATSCTPNTSTHHENSSAVSAAASTGPASADVQPETELEIPPSDEVSGGADSDEEDRTPRDRPNHIPMVQTITRQGSHASHFVVSPSDTDDSAASRIIGTIADGDNRFIVNPLGRQSRRQPPPERI